MRTLGNATAVSRFQTPILDRQILESLSWFRGRHAWKFGVEYRAGANDEIRDRGSAGNFTISPLITGLPGVSGTGNALASFLLGEVNAASIQVSDKIPSRASYLALYAQDDWRVTDRLTLNLGLRWEAELPRRVVGNKMNSFDPTAINPVSGTPGVVTFAGRQRRPRARLRHRLEQLRAARGLRLPHSRQPRDRHSRRRRHLLRPDGQQHDRRRRRAGLLDFRQLRRCPRPTLQSAFRLRDGFPAVSAPAADAGLRRGAARAKATTTRVSLLQPAIRSRPSPTSTT